MTYKLPEGRTIRVLFHACAVQKPILSLGCLAQQLTRSRRNTAKHSCTRKREFVLCQRDDGRALVDIWCE